MGRRRRLGAVVIVDLRMNRAVTILHKIEARVFSLGHMTLQKRVQRLVKDAAERIQFCASYGLPMVVALDNWRQVGVHLNHHSLDSLFGELQVVQTIDTATGQMIESRWERKDDNRPLSGGRTRMSAPSWVLLPVNVSISLRRRMISQSNAQ